MKKWFNRLGTVVLAMLFFIGLSTAPASMAIVTSGMNRSDALAAGPVAQKENAPILLTRPETLPDSFAAYLKEAAAPQHRFTVQLRNAAVIRHN
ncbi:MAG: cell wall-binding repeat-containing protein [Peptoniphilaceae bacterium]|nr:cell wall-binding repeat-containing protein [Peptoniphilaceae bacterium]MDY6085577.1 cell wall-binding repeat-containing protein [Peptoniphilaceae bacterium]